MKKLFVIVLLIFIAYLLFTRFTTVENPLQVGPKPNFPCAGPEDTPNPKKNFYPCGTLESINQTYLQEIKPIFEAKCLMCHGITKTLPRYATLPPSSWLISRNEKHAKEEINMLWDFPFSGEEAEENQDKALDEIKEVVEENAMPPLIYKLMHWESGLTAPEKAKILQWVKLSREKLGYPKEN